MPRLLAGLARYSLASATCVGVSAKTSSRKRYSIGDVLTRGSTTLNEIVLLPLRSSTSPIRACTSDPHAVGAWRRSAQAGSDFATSPYGASLTERSNQEPPFVSRSAIAGDVSTASR